MNKLSNKKKHILIIEDDPATYKALPILLEGKGYSTKLVNNAQDAIEILKNNEVTLDFVLLDLMLVNSSGIDVLLYIKEKNLPLKCAVTTASITNGVEILGCPVFLKPIDFDKLLGFLAGEDI